MNRRHPSGVGVLLLLASGPLARAQEPERPWSILLSSQVIDLRQAAAVPERLAARVEEEVGGQYALVKFAGPVTAEQYRALAASVDRVYTYLPHDTYLVKMPAERLRSDAVAATARSTAGASWVGAYHPAYKLSRSVASVSAEAAATVDAGLRPVILLVYPDADVDAVAGSVRAMGLRVVGARASGFFSRVRLLLTPAEIVRHRDALARIKDVFFVELEARRVLLNDTTVWVGQSGLSGGQTTPVFDQGIFGDGQVVGVLDTGIDADMCYFRDATQGLPPVNACNGGTVVNNSQRKVVAVDFLWSSECSGGIAGSEWDTHDHGTHVAGTVAGDNFGNRTHDAGDGMAPGAKLVIQDCGFQTDNCADCPGIGCPVVDLNPIFQQAYSQGARIHTNSWGDRENFSPHNTYSAGSQDADEFMWNHKDFLLFFAAGNDGPGTGTVGSPSTAKNVVAVGATLRGTSAGSLASFSSCGPTADGRIKPDVTIPGSGIVSADNDLGVTTNNCGTRTMSGTSMASPGAAGLTALIRQYYTDGFYPTGSANAADAFTPSAALLKATLVNSARSMESVSAPIPSNCQGWGRILLENALHFAGQTRKLFVRDDTAGFPQGSVGETRQFRFSVASGEALKATLVWTDFPSTPAASVNLVNDLDLVVTGPGGTFLGNVFSGGQSTTGGSADRRNTVEQVLLASPAAGEYVVTVQSANVPNGPQPFAVVVTGNVTPCGTTCGGGGGGDVFFDDFETDLGWSRTGTTNTATTGLWERGNPQQTVSGSSVMQLDTTPSGVNALVTGATAGTSAGANDIDGGTTSIQSPEIALPSSGTLTLSFSFYMAHVNNATSADFFRVSIVGSSGTTQVFQELGSADTDVASYVTQSVDISSFAGQTVRILIQAADEATGSLVEASVDDVRITSAGAAPDFSIACSPSSLSVAQGASGTSTCTVTSTGGFSSAVSLSCAGQPAGVSCSYSPSSVTPPANDSVNSTLTVSVASSTATGSSTFQARGTSGATVRNTNINLTVTGTGGGDVFFDDFETDLGWSRTGTTNTATTGLWERGNPQQTVSGSSVMQLDTTPSGVNALVTGATAGASAGANDIDGGTTSIQSPEIALPSSGTLTLSFSFYMAHLNNATSADFFRVSLVGPGGTTQVFQELGSADTDVASYVTQSVDISSFAGQTIRILIQAADEATGSLVEASVDDVRIVQQQ
jgi:hypothetical protein